jgi:hypothetical protein
MSFLLLPHQPLLLSLLLAPVLELQLLPRSRNGRGLSLRYQSVLDVARLDAIESPLGERETQPQAQEAVRKRHGRFVLGRLVLLLVAILTVIATKAAAAAVGAASSTPGG